MNTHFSQAFMEYRSYCLHYFSIAVTIEELALKCKTLSPGQMGKETYSSRMVGFCSDDRSSVEISGTQSQTSLGGGSQMTREEHRQLRTQGTAPTQRRGQQRDAPLASSDRNIANVLSSPPNGLWGRVSEKSQGKGRDSKLIHLSTSSMFVIKCN